MSHDGPSLEGLMRRLAETPPDFLAEPLIGEQGQVDVAAVAWDVVRDLGGEPLAFDDIASLRPQDPSSKGEQNRLRLVLICCWLLADEWFCRHGGLDEGARRLLVHATGIWAQYLRADRLLNDGDRREELLRTLLAELALRPAGESEAQAADRLQALDTAERRRVLQAAAKAEARARQIREAMARAAAQESANRYGE
ncbi:MAG: hypothetical protein KDB14_23100 [Planctomycetales bacterium]|nr:hypothetical protein [Planctomycetales bacterium]